MPRFIYTLLFYGLLPFILLRLLWRGIKVPAYWRRWGERLGFTGAVNAMPSVWVHAVSVGEVFAARLLVEALLDDYPQYQLVLTTSTPTGSAQVQRLFGQRVHSLYAPYDLPDCIHRFLRRIQPKLVIVMETEVWPNIVTLCARKQIPVVLANGRLSVKSQRGYRRLLPLFKPVFRRLTLVAAQSTVEAARFRSLGVEHVEVCGNIKRDVSLEPAVISQAQQLRVQWQAELSRPIIVAASTHRNEEALILDAVTQLQAQFPTLLLVLVPRHPERFNEVKQLCGKRGLSYVCRSDGAPVAATTAVLIGDTMGELGTLLGVADIAIMGGTFIEHGGHNFLEPALWGVPIVSGNSCYNFVDIAAGLSAAGALSQLDNTQALEAKLAALLQDKVLRHSQGQAALAFVASNRGALKRLLVCLRCYL
ncbi:MAG: lipid IV(A) 3-deoxy-D-manno-octulosonic acid transferase [Cellvibrionaceae bacterium]|nr:lipid IV(A) 3-deoxy-D-manno-octulosonic acid transferase [Cellvibrionaceae bacterium]